MEIKITEKAQKWFEEELGLSDGNGVRFLGKIYGESQIHEGFSVGIEVAKPGNIIAETTVNHIPYFIDANDEWFFAGYNLEVGFDEKHQEPEYIFHEIKE
ncbi:MAG TPA: iron-sulfur cluster biosynthesis protein [Candidatus Jeotgalibaca pullicola]|uniref:Iron-sulfur cluster biosynthesis protein n=2 Tax=Jeotgalibaca ciconiae TaxID=2496265 RepID=A0A3S9HEG5_9LACT|nr:iron-sulfur cluster biosynthesis protein [Jeotgalibaca ciconiae]HJB23490.1 iron-sulfur cluster biosynthesis protein [Candidatus Jeotgalibaca pullicola]